MPEIGSTVIVCLPFHRKARGVVTVIAGTRCLVMEEDSKAVILTSVTSLEVV